MSSLSISALGVCRNGVCSIGGTSEGASSTARGSGAAVGSARGASADAGGRLRLGHRCRGLRAEVVGRRSRRLGHGRRRRRRFGGGTPGLRCSGSLHLSDHAVEEGGAIGRRLGRAGKPGRLATRAAHGPSGRPKRRRVDHVGGRATRADDQHGTRGFCPRNGSRRPLMDRKPWGGPDWARNSRFSGACRYGEVAIIL